MEENTVAKLALYAVGDALEVLRAGKPGDRSEMDRRWAVAVTEMEKVYAYVHLHIYRQGEI